MIAALEQLIAMQELDPFDRYFVRSLQRLDPQADDLVLLAAAFTRKAVGEGNVCLTINDLQERVAGIAELGGAGISNEQLIEGLTASPLAGNGASVTPLVFEDDRLYLHRYWHYEEVLARCIRERFASFCDIDADLAEKLNSFLAEAGGFPLHGSQRLAAVRALQSKMLLVSGGPGTGKTSIVVKILLLLTMHAREQARPLPGIMLLAPTGKAAARLSVAVRAKVGEVSVDPELQGAIPDKASTIHRALGFVPQNPTAFRHNEANPLPAEVIVVDEASMVDVALMAKLFAAVRKDTHLVLLGDKDQLASVEAGSILGDICVAAQRTGGENKLANTVVELTESFRFSPERGIGRFAGGVNQGDAEGAFRVLRDSEQGEVDFVSPGPGNSLDSVLQNVILEGYGRLFAAKSPEEALHHFDYFRLLAGHRLGPFGVERLNELSEKILRREGFIVTPGSWYRGRPVLITANSYKLGLFNGDTGIVWPDHDEPGQMRLYFWGSAEGEVRSVLPLQLPPHETAYAMTIHKSQGSEFDRVAIVLPEEDSPVLTRELLYTGVTRARTHAMLIGSEEAVRGAVGRRVSRSSGLAAKLF